MEVYTELMPHPKTGALVNRNGTVCISPKTGKVLRPTLAACGYYRTPTYCTGGSPSLHRWVYEAWVGLIPEGLVINHIDGVKTNNDYTNLEAITNRENCLHAYRLGLSSGHKGEKNGNVKITEEQAIEIISKMNQGATNSEIAVEYNLHDRYVSLIRHGRRWKYLNIKSEGKSRGNEVLSEENFLAILEMKRAGKTQVYIGSCFNIDPSTVSRIWTKQAYKDMWRRLDP